jgi:phosphatidate cytidylyltransferase
MTKYINWYIFAAVNYYSLGYFFADKIPILGTWYPTIGTLLAHHGFICFMLMVVGFLAFVLSLKHGYLKYQFRLFGWIVIATLLVSIQGWLMIHNLYEGLIWYILPAFLIISNDIFAYLVGYFFGRHQLIALSPKKTWEGYIGGAISTFFFSLIVKNLLF